MCNHCCSRIAVSMTYAEWVSVALAIQHGMRMRHIIFLSVASLTLPYFSHIWHDYWTRFVENKIRVFILSTNLSKTFQSKKNSAKYHKCIYVSTTSAHLSCQIVIKLEFSRNIFEKFSYIKFHEDPSSRSRVVSCGRTDGQI